MLRLLSRHEGEAVRRALLETAASSAPFSRTTMYQPAECRRGHTILRQSDSSDHANLMDRPS
jgi:hypothetical protein